MLNKLQALRKKMKKKGKGFTLVELIVVIIIIAIIAAVAIPSITSFQNNARRSRVRTEHRQLISAIQSWKGTLEDPTDVTTVKTLTMDKLYPYISGLPKNADEAAFKAKMAKNPDGAEASHAIVNTELVSKFVPTGETKAKAEDTWKYDFAADAQ